jgi:hypothetical protein
VVGALQDASRIPAVAEGVADGVAARVAADDAPAESGVERDAS